MQKLRFIIPTVILLVVLYFIIFRGRETNPISPFKIATSQPDTSPIAKTIEIFNEILQNELDSSHTVGAAYTIVYNGEVRYLKAYGVKISGTTDSVNFHTIFRLASVSKGFAGVLACIMEQKGNISLEDPVKKYLPSFSLRDTVNTTHLKIKHLLSHTTGLVPHAFDNLAEEGVPYPIIVSELNTVEISGKPGQVYSYQNIIYSLLDTILFNRTGNTYGELLTKHIFRPLKMRDASTGPEIFTNTNSNVAYPHIRNEGGFKAINPNLGYYNVLPAAGVNASITDMSRWLLALMGYKLNVLDTNLLNIIETPLVSTPLKRSYTHYWGKVNKREYSLGWRIFTYKGRKVIYHGGFVQGYRAEIAYIPDENIGIAFLENSPDEVASKFVPYFLNCWFEKSKTVVSDSSNIIRAISDTAIFEDE